MKLYSRVARIADAIEHGAASSDPSADATYLRSLVSLLEQGDVRCVACTGALAHDAVCGACHALALRMVREQIAARAEADDESGIIRSLLSLIESLEARIGRVLAANALLAEELRAR